jgi:hypothetical protein
VTEGSLYSHSYAQQEAQNRSFEDSMDVSEMPDEENSYRPHPTP